MQLSVKAKVIEIKVRHKVPSTFRPKAILSWYSKLADQQLVEIGETRRAQAL